MEIFDKSSFFFAYVRKKQYLCTRKGLITYQPSAAQDVK